MSAFSEQKINLSSEIDDDSGFQYIYKIGNGRYCFNWHRLQALQLWRLSIAYEVHAEENANQEHFEKTLEGKVLNFKDVFSKNTISIQRASVKQLKIN